jgi:DNA-binding response OmpR family regulator
MLTGASSHRNLAVHGLALGADDYLAKPFAIAERDARVEAVARRRHGQVDPRIIVRDLEIDLAAKKVVRAGKLVTLTAREFSLLQCLARKPGQVFSRQQIEARMYEEDLEVDLGVREFAGFGSRAGGDYFEILAADGRTLENSSSLGNDHLREWQGEGIRAVND